MTKDLTTGSPIKLILGFALPTLLGLLFQQLYSVVDTIIVGQLLGPDALAAVGTTTSLFFMVMGFIIGISNGFAIPVAQRMGAGQIDLMRRYVFNASYLAIGFAAVLTVLTTTLCHRILIATNTPSNIFDAAHAYAFIFFCGIPATFLYNLVAAIIRALGDSKTPVFFLALASILNIALDYLLIAYTPYGVAGAAAATVISQGVSGVACLIYMKKKFTILQPQPTELALNPQICRVLCLMGLPMGLQYSITAVGNIILQTAVNGLGSLAVGAVTAGQKLSLMFWCPLEALGQTMATYCGQNVGAMKVDRIRKGVLGGTAVACGYSILILGIILPFGRKMLSVFVGDDVENITQFLDMSNEYLVICSAFLVPLALVNLLRFSIQGMGFTNFAMIAGGMEMVARICVAQFMVPKMGFTAACLGSPIAWIAADIFLVPATFMCIKTLQGTADQTT